jgi:hypothetical protein
MCIGDDDSPSIPRTGIGGAWEIKIPGAFRLSKLAGSRLELR